MIQGAVETLKYFKEEGYKLGLVSNTIFPDRFHLTELKTIQALSLSGFDPIFL